jgi:hypothetical protein
MQSAIEKLHEPTNDREAADMLYEALRGVVNGFVRHPVMSGVPFSELDVYKARAALTAGYALGAYEKYRHERDHATGTGERLDD